MLTKRFIFFLEKILLFGFQVMFWRILNSKKHKIKIFSEIINENRHKAVINFLSKDFMSFISNYKKNISHKQFQNQIPKQIWLCWWTGVDSMPSIVKACYNSVLINANDFHVTLITKDNYTNYISIPDHILNKVNLKLMSLTHFSNIIRMSLLEKYGGLWLDATIFFTGKINIDDTFFFTVKRNYGSDNVAKQRWAGNCLGGVPDIYLFNFIKEFLFEYWIKYDFMVEHHLYDYSIALAYNLIPEIKEIFDCVNINNENYMILGKCLEDEYDPVFFEKIIKDTIFHKLTWKKNISSFTSENKLTFYGYLLQNTHDITHKL